jgi:intracellular multiplication protein IcmD
MKHSKYFSRIFLSCFLIGSGIAGNGEAGSDSVTDMGSSAANIASGMTDLAKLVTAGFFVAGLACTAIGLMNFKQWIGNPQQNNVSKGFVYLSIGVALCFLPSLFSIGGATIFGSSAAGGDAAGFDSVSDSAVAA